MTRSNPILRAARTSVCGAVALLMLSFSAQAQETMGSIKVNGNDATAIPLEVHHPVGVTQQALTDYFGKLGVKGKTRKGITIYYAGLKPSESKPETVNLYIQVKPEMGTKSILYVAAGNDPDHLIDLAADTPMNEAVHAFLRKFEREAAFVKVPPKN